MKPITAALCLLLSASPVLAQDKSVDTDKKAPATAEKSKKTTEVKEPSDKQKAQQARMKDCSAKAGDRKSDDRKSFMSACLKGADTSKKSEGGTTAKSAQQDKMKSCNREAGDKKMKGDERKVFMKDCLAK
jgi:hypothetical protein